MPELEGQYELIRELGRGGTAIVYLARELGSGGEVAVKLIRPGFSSDSEAVARLAREATLVAKLRHPNIVSLLATRHLRDGSLALIMQYVPGITLKEAIQRSGAAPLTVVRSVLRDVGSALAYAHEEHGIIHRDLKPQNIYLDVDKAAALLSDFGIARASGESNDITLAGATVGTPAYMSPEQVDGRELDGRSDLYSLGMVSYQMLTGRPPWEGHNLYAIVYKQKHESLPPLTELRPDLRPDLRVVIEGLLEKAPEDRWSSAESVVRRLGLPDIHREAEALREWVNRTPLEDGESIDWHEHAPTVRIPAEPVASDQPGRESFAGWVAPERAAGVRRSKDGPSRSSPPAPARRTLARTAVFVVALLIAGGLGWLAVQESAEGLDGFAWILDASPFGPAEDPSGPASADAGGMPARVQIVEGGAQVGRVGTPLETPVLVRVEDDAGRPLSGVPVELRIESGGGSIVPEAGVTDDSGVLSAEWTLGAAPGENLVAAVLPSGDAATSARAIGVPSEAAALLAMGSTDRFAPPGATLAEPVMARVEDEFGNPLSGVLVEFVAAEGEGSVSEAVVLTDRDGLAATRWTLGPETGTQRLVASVLASDTEVEWIATASPDAVAEAPQEEGPEVPSPPVESPAEFEPEALPGIAESVGSSPDPPALAPRAMISAGGMHTCRLTAQGGLACWGGNGNGQLGDGSAMRSAAPVAPALPETFAIVATGISHTCAASTRGRAYCWGDNDRGQLGDGTREDRAAPVPVAGDHYFVELSAGLSHTCGRTDGGEVYCWGENTDGQLGDGTTQDRAEPVRVSMGPRAVVVSAGWDRTCSLTGVGEIWCWGQGVPDASSQPTQVGGGRAFMAVSAGASHVCGLTREGQVLCWGENRFGQLGVEGGGRAPSDPAVVDIEERFVSITVGANHTCALNDRREAHCWGQNTFGQLGDGSSADSSAPVRVDATLRFAELSSTGSHTCGRTEGGAVYCWGNNLEGQLGDGTRDHRGRPVELIPAEG